MFQQENRTAQFVQAKEVRMRKLMLLVVFILVLGLVACGGESAPASEGGQATGAGDAGAGKELFNQGLIGTQPGCMTCHSLEPGVTLVGPSLASIGAEAGSMVSGQSAEEYLRQSILAPGEYVVEGFADGIMPANYGDELSEQQLNDLVAFLLSLK
jgi:sulfur-oxidizing protein SoxX